MVKSQLHISLMGLIISKLKHSVLCSLGLAASLLAMSVFASEKQEAETVLLLADDWCPYSCIDGLKPGIGIEIGQRIFEQLGFRVEHRIMDWEQASQLTMERPLAVLVGTGISESPELVFPNYHFSYTLLCFVHTTTSKYYEVASDFNNKRLGAVTGYNYGQAFGKTLAQLYRNKQLDYFDNTDQLVAALTAGQIDVIIDDKNVIMHKLREAGKVSAYRFDSCSRSKLRFAFSPQTAASHSDLAEQLDKAQVKLLKEGGVKSIHRDYGIENY